MKGGSFIEQLHKTARDRDVVSKNCVATVKGNAAPFLARYILLQLREPNAAWNTNMFTVINAVVDHLMSEDGFALDSAERLNYVYELTRALPMTHGYESLDFGIWDLFTSRGRSVLSPSHSFITEASLDQHILLARIYLKQPDVESKVRSFILNHGPEALSTFSMVNKRASPLFRGFLKAAISTRNLDLVCLFLAHDIDITHDKPRKKGGVAKKQTSFYDGYFLHLAIYSGDCGIIDALMQRRLKNRMKPAELMRSAVCSGHKAVACKLLEHLFPLEDITSGSECRLYSGDKANIMENALHEACSHKDSATVEVLLSRQYTATCSGCVSTWKLGRPSRVFAHKAFRRRWAWLAEDGVMSPLGMCIKNRDMACLKQLIEHDLSPDGESVSVKGRVHVFAIATDEKSPMPILLPLWLCAWRGTRLLNSLLQEADFCCTAREWLAVALMFSSRPRITETMIEPHRPVDRVDWELQGLEFWKWLVGIGVFKIGDLLSECGRLERRQREPGLEQFDVEKVKAFLLTT
ncbi:hypothetical protein AK830_g5094 [Neonectria ditissima]|uniref:Uncharacterized protein n=1 Tax=Neonectria ditissima TaxID=78410 RepID=A0A0P7AUD4_9HYPO|nr:hypothetical protein AK830_g5094 [Neonectria ditissima]